MFEHREHENGLLFSLRWTARLSSVVCLAIIFLFFIGEGIDFQAVKSKEWVGLFFFPLGVLIGLVLAWREEIAGGAVTVLSVIGFYLIYGLLLSGSVWQGWAFLPFFVPGILFLVYGFQTRVARFVLKGRKV
jgi:hypothetical protein